MTLIDDHTVLLVDDEADIRDVLEIALMDLGYSVLTAEDGENGLEIFCRHHPPIVLTDIKMPGMDGIELLRRIKHQNREAEVIMITGHGDMNLAIKSLKYEATEFITKPINVDALELALKRAVERILIRRQLADYTQSLEALVREKAELQDRLASLGLMIGSISHGIKGLLTGLDGGMYLVESGFSQQDQEKVDEGWVVVKMMVDRIRKMILDILYYAKERPLRWERIDVLDFVREVAAGMAPKIAPAGIDFVKDFNAGLGGMEIDSGAMHSALINILDNAVDACIRDTEKSGHRVVFGARQEADGLCFTVEDNGTGMDRETREKLFTLFFSSKGVRGTGLGLFVSNNIIRQHGGEIQVTTTPGHGTKFTVHLPRHIPESIRLSPDGTESVPGPASTLDIFPASGDGWMSRTQAHLSPGRHIVMPGTCEGKETAE
jgi:signal transduction histidine kinase